MGAGERVLRCPVRHQRPRCSHSSRRQVRRDDRVQSGDIVLFYSDNARNYGTDAYWTGWSYPDADAARALIDRGVSAVGFDGPSADPVDSTTMDLHRIWLGAGRMILENVNNLDQLPARAPIVVAPMKVAAATGAPVRIFALLPD